MSLHEIQIKYEQYKLGKKQYDHYQYFTLLFLTFVTLVTDQVHCCLSTALLSKIHNIMLNKQYINKFKAYKTTHLFSITPLQQKFNNLKFTNENNVM